MSKIKAYISGPMSGFPDNNYPAFKKAAKKYRKLGYDVLSPTEIDKKFDPPNTDENWWFFVRRDLDAIWHWRPNVIVMLPGSRDSVGANLEKVMISMRMGGEVIWDINNEDSKTAES